MKPSTQMKLLHIRSWAMLWAALALVLAAGAGGLLVFLKLVRVSESTAFCGSTCHVMKPERVSHDNSPHAKVDCGTCHIGPGVAYMVRSKIESMRETVNFATHRYPQPIPSPIKRLRPARVICEQCHWPQKYYGDKLVSKRRFTPDEHNTPQWFSLTLKTGGQETPQREGQGIHWHITQELDYASVDPKRQVIPWIKVKRGGRETIYRLEDFPGADAMAAKPENQRRMDCLDCHNRAAHKFPFPDDLLDEYLGTGQLPAGLPWLKREALRLLQVRYASEEEARLKMAGVADFYAKQYPDLYRRSKDEIEALAPKLMEIVERTQFPAMKADWLTHLDNIGHTRGGAGCFRCHDGKHSSSDGKVISQDCNLCHTSLAFGKGEPPKAAPVRAKLKGATHGSLECVTCHGGPPNQAQTGIKSLWPKDEACGQCHSLDEHRPEGGAMAQLDCGECHRLHADSPKAPSCAGCHVDAGKKGAHTLHLGMGLNCAQCHPPHAFKPTAKVYAGLCANCHPGVKLEDLVPQFLKEK